MRYLLSAASAALLFSLLPACGDDDDNFGLVTAEWSFEGRLDANECRRIGADLFEMVFFDERDIVAAEVEENCEAFSASIRLREGRYNVATRLITAQQEEVSDTLFFDGVLVEEGVGAVLHADFPVEPTP